MSIRLTQETDTWFPGAIDLKISFRKRNTFCQENQLSLLFLFFIQILLLGINGFLLERSTF